MPVIELPSALRARAAGQTKVKVEGATVAEALDALCRAHPELRPQLFAHGGQLKRSIGVFVEDDEPPSSPREASPRSPRAESRGARSRGDEEVLDSARTDRMLVQLDGRGLSRALRADELVVLIAAMAGG